MNSFGQAFRVSVYGESHGNSVGVIIDGCPAGLELCEEDLMGDLIRRKSGAKGTTPRKESDLPHFMSGVFNGKTTGAPLNIQFENSNTRSSDYLRLREAPRPGHADFVASAKYGGFEDYRGGGHFSGRLTLAIVAAGVIAKKILGDVIVKAKLLSVGGSENIDQAVEKAIEEKDSVGGIVECEVQGLPAGLGEPFFDSMESMISHMVFSIPAIKGIEFGSGFHAAGMKGSEHNDSITDLSGTTETNNSGGINGGISNGNPLIYRVAVKPTSSISLPQNTLNLTSGKVQPLIIEGRHDVCIALRVPPVLEGATAIVLTDFMLQQGFLPRIIKTQNQK